MKRGDYPQQARPTFGPDYRNSWNVMIITLTENKSVKKNYH